MAHGALKAAIVILASPETHEGFGRVANALQVARELAQAGDEVAIIFMGPEPSLPPSSRIPSIALVACMPPFEIG